MVDKKNATKIDVEDEMEGVSADTSAPTPLGITDDQIDGYIDLKMQEVYDLEHSPHPVEFKNYFSV